MSEYQYYEFIALDKPLSQAQMQALSEVSSRAEISSTRFVNVYNYGDFRGDVDEFMTRYFDAMVYVDNWGTHRLMLRLPGDLIDRAQLKRYCAEESLSLRVRGKFVVLDFCNNLEDYAGWEEGEGWLAALVPLRAELLNVDLRALYLAWLLSVQCEELDEDEEEPPVPPGLEAWVAALPEAEKNALLLKIIKGQELQPGARLLQRFRSSAGLPTDAVPAPRRTVGELLQAAQRCRDARNKAEADRKAKARASYLDDLALRENAVWNHIEERIDTKQAKAYAEAISLLKDLRELNASRNQTTQFEQRLSGLYERQRRKLTFIKGLQKAGLR